MHFDLVVGDCLDVLRQMPDDSVDLVLTSPPYEDARTYGIDFNLKGEAWVEWAVERYLECVRVCRGLVVWVVEGKTKGFRYSATPFLLMAELHRRGVRLRKPPIFYRVGVPGSGGPDWWRNDYELCVASSKGRLPWSDNVATGQPCRYPPGGAMSNRHADGARRNAKTGVRLKSGRVVLREHRPGRRADDKTEPQLYAPPEKANPGNVIQEAYKADEVAAMLGGGDVVKCAVGGGKMGSPLAHENEAPFPEALVTPFILSFCPPGGVVLDPFCGSGTTLKAAIKHGRRAMGVDVRASQENLTRRRIAEVV